MTINSSRPLSNAEDNVPEPGLRCPNCNSADDLVLESLGPVSPPRSDRVSVEYSCGQCEAFFAHSTSLQNAAWLLASAPGTEILKVGGSYIHCGEPMEEAHIELSTLRLPTGDLAQAPAVRVVSSVLRCRCGFQMSIPAR